MLNRESQKRTSSRIEVWINGLPGCLVGKSRSCVAVPSEPLRFHGTVARQDPWYVGRDLTAAERLRFREISRSSREAKLRSLQSDGSDALHTIYQPRLNPDDLMEAAPPTGRTSLSLFSGGGGLDLGFERAGFRHIASYELLKDAGQTLRTARPEWTVFCGQEGDVRHVDWRPYRGEIDVLHGGPPCQPFSSAGRQRGAGDERDMFPEFVRAVLDVKPAAFVAENVPALASAKFRRYLETTVLQPLSRAYSLTMFGRRADSFGVPQVRKRLFLVGFRFEALAAAFCPPRPTHTPIQIGHASSMSSQEPGLFHDSDWKDNPLEPCMGVRQALGLEETSYDALAPTIRSSLTGPRHTTSILSSVTAAKTWKRLAIWPNGVASSRENARRYPAPNGHYRLSVEEVALVQGFPSRWSFHGAVYMALGQIGNAVPPPMAYNVARSVAEAFGGLSSQTTLAGRVAG